MGTGGRERLRLWNTKQFREDTERSHRIGVGYGMSHLYASRGPIASVNMTGRRVVTSCSCDHRSCVLINLVVVTALERFVSEKVDFVKVGLWQVAQAKGFIPTCRARRTQSGSVFAVLASNALSHHHTLREDVERDLPADGVGEVEVGKLSLHFCHHGLAYLRRAGKRRWARKDYRIRGNHEQLGALPASACRAAA